MVSEILPFDQDWSEVEILPSATPYGSNFPGSMCSVLLNSTTVMVMGGFQSGALSSARLLDLNNFVWTDVADMINGKHTHACTLTAEGQVFQSFRAMEFTNFEERSWKIELTKGTKKQSLCPVGPGLLHSNFHFAQQ